MQSQERKKILTKKLKIKWHLLFSCVTTFTFTCLNLITKNCMYICNMFYRICPFKYTNTPPSFCLTMIKEINSNCINGTGIIRIHNKLSHKYKQICSSESDPKNTHCLSWPIYIYWGLNPIVGDLPRGKFSESGEQIFKLVNTAMDDNLICISLTKGWKTLLCFLYSEE